MAQRITKPKMILFDYGQTLGNEKFNGVRGTEAVLKYATENKYNLTAQQVQKEAEAINQELGRFDPVKRYQNTIELPNYMFTNYLYETVGIKLSLTPAQIDQVFWDNAAPATPTEGIEGFTYGNDLNSALDSAGPLPYIDLSGEQNAIELAEFGANGKYTAMAMKDMGDWTSIYSTTMNLPSTFWRNLIKEADGHIWSDNESDIIHASEHYLSVYSLFGGERTITLPKSEYSVYDVYEEKYIPVTGNTFKFTMEDNSGRLFRLMSANKVAVLARTNGAHATLDKLGVTEVTPGADYTVSIKVDQGYYLSAVTVNGKQVDVQKTIKLKDVVNSTEIVFEVKQVKTYDSTVEQPVQPSDSGEESETPETPIEEETKMPSKEENNKVTQMPSIFVTTTTIKWGKIILLFAGILSGVAIVATMIEVLAVYFRRKKNSRRK